MADRYQNQHFPSAADQARGENDPLAELARLIGQTDQFGSAPAKPAPHPLQSRANLRPPQYDPPAEDIDTPPSPPSWMQRARQETTPPPPLPSPLPEDYDNERDYQPQPVHPLHRYSAKQAPAQDYYDDASQQHEAPQQYADEPQQQDPSRYDDALYGRLENGEQDYQRDPAYPNDPYAYQGDDYEEEPEPKKRSSGLITVAAVLALAVVGTGAAFAYRTYVGSPRSGEPPIIRADNSPTKVMPAPSDGGAAKTPDRMVPGDGGEKLVSREETPVDVNARSGGPRVVFPPLNQNSSPPPVASVSPTGPAPASGANGTMPNNEPRRIKTLAVKGDPADNGGIPAGATAPPPKPMTRSAAAVPPPAAPSPSPAASPSRNPASANASANGPMSIAPQADPAPSPSPTRMAATNPTQPATPSGGGYLVQVSSQKSEADAQAAYRALQGKYPSVLGAQSSMVKRVDLGEKGVYYRAFAGPFGSSEEAAQVCNSLKSAGGQCFVQRN
ncbi:SPOR domain-containing protein [Bradyrhizobium sp. WSM 1738]|uniref:SPOR domain-containing protein n=1 Tax=Bradyrhizobium hereditatis TaxID=2821405 RepID=UPI001CE27923|nr:SPOR domain-containing protein [Bradyrhizobium hereditatis]MCA6114028.1 SPOR domain-containing protein [Bradyrhizobium hereditatis]